MERGYASDEIVSASGKPTPDVDARKLAEMGYKQDMRRNFSVLSVLGVGFSITNSWFGISAGLITGINSGGPILIVYGIILCALIATCVGISLSELASAMPNAGGQYFWASELAHPSWANFASYLTGWLAWAGAIFTSASVALATGSALVGCWQLAHPDFIIQSWHIVLAYQLVNIFCFWFNCYGKTLPHMSSLSLGTSLVSFLVTLIVIPAKAPTHSEARFVFAEFANNTGWTQNGIAFIVGLVNTNWAFACLDCATHLAEEVHAPERMVPVAIMGTVAIGFVTSWFYSISMFFSVQDLNAIFNTPTLVPILELYSQALVSKVSAIFFETLIICTGVGCLIASHTWQSRLAWSFARDRGLPYHTVLSKVHPTLDVPIPAHVVSCCIVALLGCIYLGSSDALSSIITACVVLLYLSYAVPVICLLLKGRNNIKRGPFWLGKWGLLSNIVLLAWTLFTLVMYSFPTFYPPQANNMNYAAVVYAVVLAIILADWFIRGRKAYRGQHERHEEGAEMVRGVEQQPWPELVKDDFGEKADAGTRDTARQSIMEQARPTKIELAREKGTEDGTEPVKHRQRGVAQKMESG